MNESNRKKRIIAFIISSIIIFGSVFYFAKITGLAISETTVNIPQDVLNVYYRLCSSSGVNPSDFTNAFVFTNYGQYYDITLTKDNVWVTFNADRSRFIISGHDPYDTDIIEFVIYPGTQEQIFTSPSYIYYGNGVMFGSTRDIYYNADPNENIFYYENGKSSLISQLGLYSVIPTPSYDPAYNTNVAFGMQNLGENGRFGHGIPNIDSESMHQAYGHAIQQQTSNSTDSDTNLLTKITTILQNIGGSVTSFFSSFWDNFDDALSFFSSFIVENLGGSVSDTTFDDVIDAYSQTYFYSFINATVGLADTLHDFFNVDAAESPTFTVSFQDTPFDYIDDFTFDFSWYEKIRDKYLLIFMGIFSATFLFRLIRNIPSLINGMSGATDGRD